MEINQKFLDELENLIRQMRRALRMKERIEKMSPTIQVDVPFFNKKIDYTVTQADKDKVNQEATDTEQALKDKIKEIDKAPAQI